MRYLTVLRLLLEVYGATFLGVMLIAVAIYGVFPYEALTRLGSVMFYALMSAAFAVWLWLAARMLAQHPGEHRDPSTTSSTAHPDGARSRSERP